MSRIHHIALHTLCGLLLWAPTTSWGQQGHAFIHHFDRKEVAGELTSWNLVAVRNDRVAAANGDGLLLHDGASWQLHALPNQAAARSIAALPEGRWLVGGQGFLGTASDEGMKACTFEDWTPNVVKEAGGFEDVWRLFPLPQSVTTEQPQFFVSTSNFTGIVDASGQFQLLRQGSVINGFTWGERAVGWQVGDSIWQWKDGVTTGLAIPEGLRIEAVHERADGTLQVFTHRNGILTGQNTSAPEWSFAETALSQYLRANRTNCVLKDGPGQWWIGTSRGGIVKSLDLEQVHLIHDKASGLCNNAVTSVTLDDQGNLWAATEGGIDLIRLSWPVKKAEPRVIADQPGFASHHDWDNQRIFWGTSQGLYVEDMTSGEVKRLEDIPGPVWAIQALGAQVWASHINGCGVIANNLTYQPVIDDVGVWGIWQAPDDHLYAGTFQGVRPVDFNADGAPEAGPMLQGFAESSRFMHFDTADTLWVSHPYKGAYRLAIDRSAHRVMLVNAFGSDKGFPEPMDVYLRNVDGELLFATSEGIYEWQRERDRMALASGNWVEWLDSKAAFSLIETDERGDLWAFSGEVLLRFSAKRKQLNAAVEVTRAPFTDAPTIDGFEKVEFLPDGRVCAPTETGFVYVDPRAMLAEQDVPVVQIDQVIHLNHPSGTKALPLDELDLPAGSHALQIDLTSDDSRWTGRLKYQWRIPDVSEDWSAPQFGHTIALNGLQSGTHTVEFRAMINPALTGPTKSLSIVIEKPWHQRWSVRAAFFLFTLLLFGAWVRRNKRRLERTHQLATKQQQAEIQAVESKLAEERLQFAQSQVQAKDAELASVTMNLVQKAQLVQTVQSNLQKIKSNLDADRRKEVDHLLKMIQESGKLDDAWEQFTQQFDQVHIDFHQRLMDQFPDLTKNDVKLCSYLRMGLSTKEIASLMFVTVRAVEVSRSRLRKRLQLAPDVKLTTFIQNL